MLEPIVKALVAGLALPGFSMKPDQGARGPTMKILIPKDHPKAGALLKLASFLASKEVFESGLEIDRSGGPCLPADAERMMLDLIREIVDPDHIDGFLEKCACFARERQASQFFDAAQLADPKMLQGMLQFSLEAGAMSQAERKSREWLVNVSESLKRKI